MAYRRRQHPISSSSSSPAHFDETDPSSSSSSLAAKALRASSSAAPHRDSSLSSAYGPHHPPSPLHPKDSESHEYNDTSMRKLEDESKHGFWGALARKAKTILDDNDVAQQHVHTTPKYHNPYHPHQARQKTDSPTLQKGFSAITSSLNYIGNAVEGGLTIVENRTAGIIQETRKHIRKKPSNSQSQNQSTKQPQMKAQLQPQMQTEQEIQLKASRDVAMAMAAKAKLLLRELKTVKADLAFAKERCAQLEEENKIIRENRERGDSPEDDDLIRLQLETLLAEKARLAHENSVYARENRFLREVVEYHQLTMQDVVYLDEGTEEVTEVYPIKAVPDLHSAPTASIPKPCLLPPEAL
ncbi:hypothetical protein CFOL_v3_02127 [Cephalotus follicularis]|uniref:Uncharacterized protein n=1 Tax=Cephalotus follicularis TaxID=3775 RepID=A0A1Q3ASF3_CEPFO|nr:hypothetical protein CFOL_v3_02127 [Cephalotus follicularis]